MAKVELGISKLLLVGLLASIGPVLTTSRAVAQDTRAVDVTATATVPVNCGFVTSATTNFTLVVNQSDQTFTTATDADGAARVDCNDTGATLTVATLTEGNDNPEKVADGDLGLTGTVTVTQVDGTTDEINLTWPASGSFSASTTETLQLGTTNIDLDLTGTFANSFTVIPEGTYTYTIGLTVAAP